MSRQNLEYDGLVIVYPEAHNASNPNYITNLREYVALCNSLGRHVFLVNDDEPLIDQEIKEILKDAIRVPVLTENDDYILLSGLFYKTDIEKLFDQLCVDFIARKIGKDPEDISLGFGGTYASACVYAYASTWCEKVDTDQGTFGESEICEHPLKYSAVIDDLV